MLANGSRGAGAQRDVAVCVPVRNEEELLPRLLQAVAEQQEVAHDRLVLCLFLDGCSDGSEAVIEAARADLSIAIRIEQDPGGPAHAGRARRRATAMGVAALGGQPDAVLLTTDADTTPARDWIARNLAALRKADLIAGDIRTAEPAGSDHHDRVKAYYDRLHLLNTLIDPVPWEAERRHHHAGGASLAFRCAAYQSVGGFPDLARGEDAAFVALARQCGLRVRRDADVVVHTSTRRSGRVDGGFAAHLSALDAAGTAATLMVVDPEVAARQYRAHARARRVFRAPSAAAVSDLARRVGLPTAAVTALLADAVNAEAFALRLVPMPTDAQPLPLAEAERRLARLVGHRRPKGGGRPHAGRALASFEDVRGRPILPVASV